MVASFAKKKRRTRESSFEDKFAKALGRPSWHMAMREAGWPDRYIHGGIWCELKSLDVLGLENGLEKEQVIKLNELTRAGEPCFYCAKIGDRIVLIEWEEFKRHHLAPVECPTYAYKDLKEAIKYVIDGRHAS